MTVAVDIRQIAPATRTVPLGSGTVEITGLSLRKLTALVVSFPQLLDLAAGKMDLAELVLSAPDAALALFAAAAVVPATPKFWQFWNRFRPDEAAILRAFDQAATGAQIDVLAQLFEITFEGPRAGPFLEAVLNMIRAPDAGLKDHAAPATSEPEMSEPNMPSSSST